MPRRVVVVHLWQVAIAFIAVTASFIVQGILLAHLGHRNRELIREQQASRIVSCKHTYEGVREIFRPLLPPLRQRTPKMRRDLATFNRTIDKLKARCDVQTQPKGTR